MMSAASMMRAFLLLSVFLTFFAQSSSAFTSADVRRITVDELYSRMKAGDGVVVVDVRTRRSYDASPYKIKGALRIAPDEVLARAQELPADKDIALYCT